MAQKPGIPKGTRDFTPAEMVRRNYIFDTIRQVFQKYGYLPIETPAMESLDTLLGKYGEEGDKLLFRILNSGDFLSKIETQDLNNKNSAALSGQICEKGLRYDLTVPFARFIVQHRNEINFPFKRYQIQPVWRADRPQKGRYREFYQCDVDVIGSNSLLNEAELIQIIDNVFNKLNIRVEIKLNNRKILAGIADYIDEKERFTDITVAIDKLEKIGREKVNEELSAKGLKTTSIDKLQPVLALGGDTGKKISTLKELLKETEIGKNGLDEMQKIFEYTSILPLSTKPELDLTLARGLNYYTGAIIEVKASDIKIGSICGGGRYDDLTGIFGLPDVSGVGISFGADRIYDVMQQLELFPENQSAGTQVMFVNFGEYEEHKCLELVSEFRETGISTEYFPDAVKMKKQMAYADKNNIPYVALVGEEEIRNNVVTIKNMKTGEQFTGKAESIIAKLANLPVV